jgi:hypothetical protein
LIQETSALKGHPRLGADLVFPFIKVEKPLIQDAFAVEVSLPPVLLFFFTKEIKGDNILPQSARAPRAGAKPANAGTFPPGA